MPQYIFHKCSNSNYVMTGPYNSELVEELKAGLEWWQRRWDPDQAGWQIHREAFRKAAEICMRYGQVKFVDQDIDEPERQRQAEAKTERERQERERERQARERRDREAHERYQREQRERRGRDGWRSQAAAPQSGGASDPYSVLHLQPNAPWPVVRAAYRALVALHHPSSGHEGTKDEQRMVEVNLAYERICKERGER